MLNLPPTVRIYACTSPCDMRKQIDGLAALVEHQLKRDARSGHLFLAFNRRGDMVRLLFWDVGGFCLVTKRLEAGTFRLPWRGADVTSSLELDGVQLAKILDGVELRRVKQTVSNRFLGSSDSGFAVCLLCDSFKKGGMLSHRRSPWCPGFRA